MAAYVRVYTFTFTFISDHDHNDQTIAIEFEFDNDSQALECGKLLVKNQDVEIVCGHRFVALVKSSGVSKWQPIPGTIG
jgi:hypothetical protein